MKERITLRTDSLSSAMSTRLGKSIPGQVESRQQWRIELYLDCRVTNIQENPEVRFAVKIPRPSGAAHDAGLRYSCASANSSGVLRLRKIRGEKPEASSSASSITCVVAGVKSVSIL